VTIHALISGSLFGEPLQKVSKTGRNFAVVTLRSKDGDAVQWIRVTVFSESAQAELLRLQDGDAVSVQGPFKAETYVAADGSTKISLSITADNILPLRQPPKEPKTKTAVARDMRPKTERLRGSWRDERDGPCDEIPF
jgi:single-stranded DNA-binding protein